MIWALLAAAHAAVPAAPAVQVLLRVLSYDRALPARTVAPLDVAVVFVGDDALSAEQAREVGRALAALGGTTVQGFPLGEPAMVDARNGLSTLAGVDAVFLCRGTSAVVTQAAAAAGRAPLLALDADLVGDGAAVGLAVTQARLGLVIDLAAARSQGLDLSSEVLQLAKIVGR